MQSTSTQMHACLSIKDSLKHKYNGWKGNEFILWELKWTDPSFCVVVIIPNRRSSPSMTPKLLSIFFVIIIVREE